MIAQNIIATDMEPARMPMALPDFMPLTLSTVLEWHCDLSGNYTREKMMAALPISKTQLCRVIKNKKDVKRSTFDRMLSRLPWFVVNDLRRLIPPEPKAHRVTVTCADRNGNGTPDMDDAMVTIIEVDDVITDLTQETYRDLSAGRNPTPEQRMARLQKLTEIESHVAMLKAIYTHAGERVAKPGQIDAKTR